MEQDLWTILADGGETRKIYRVNGSELGICLGDLAKDAGVSKGDQVGVEIDENENIVIHTGPSDV